MFFLRPREDKYTFSAIFQITNRAEIKHSWIGKTIIHSNHRFTYEEVQEIIEKKDGLHHKPILLLNGLAQQFRKKGSITVPLIFRRRKCVFNWMKKGKNPLVL